MEYKKVNVKTKNKDNHINYKRSIKNKVLYLKKYNALK